VANVTTNKIFQKVVLLVVSNEGSPLEPAHIHIQKAEALAKFWVEPKVELEHSYCLSSKELKQLKKNHRRQRKSNKGSMERVLQIKAKQNQ